jgi:hypothetical protein
MSKREKIILVIMALTVVYGFYALFLENPSREAFRKKTPTSSIKFRSNGPKILF